MKTPRVFRFFLAGLFFLALAPLVWGCGGGAPMAGQATVTAAAAPAGESTPQVESPTSAPALTPTASAPVQPALLESRRLTLEFPTKIRAGNETEVIRLTLEVDDLGNITPTAKYQGNIVTGEVIEIPDLYDTHNVTAEARLDLAGMIVQPSGAIYEPLKRGQPATFQWSVRPQETGNYRGTVWLHLNFENRSTGEKDRVAVSAQIIEIEAVDFFGFSTDFIRTSGALGSALGLIVGFPFFEDFLKYLFISKRNKKKKK